jgi:hypothetical protein
MVRICRTKQKESALLKFQTTSLPGCTWVGKVLGIDKYALQ